MSGLTMGKGSFIGAPRFSTRATADLIRMIKGGFEQRPHDQSLKA